MRGVYVSGNEKELDKYRECFLLLFFYLLQYVFFWIEYVFGPSSFSEFWN